MLKPNEKFMKAQSLLLRDFPFFGSILLNLKVEEVVGMPTMATDGTKLMYGPEYVERQDLTIVITDQAHEAGHVVFMDPLRRGSRDPKVWNMATDYRINAHLRAAGFKLGDDYLYDPAYDGMDAEK